MGWRDRDWARLNDDELRALYGVERRATSPLPVPRSPHRALSVRAVVWPVVAALFAVVGTGGLLAAHRLRGTAPPGSVPTPSVLYGVRGTAGHGMAPGQDETVCTDLQLVVGRWTCTSWLVNDGRLPVVVPRSYQGTCAHVSADQSSGGWVCLSEVTEPPGA